MGHDNSRTIVAGKKGAKKFHNITTVVEGKSVSDEKAKAHAIKSKTLGKAFHTKADAVRAADDRSKNWSPYGHRGKK